MWWILLDASLNCMLTGQSEKDIFDSHNHYSLCGRSERQYCGELLLLLLSGTSPSTNMITTNSQKTKKWGEESGVWSFFNRFGSQITTERKKTMVNGDIVNQEMMLFSYQSSLILLLFPPRVHLHFTTVPHPIQLNFGAILKMRDFFLWIESVHVQYQLMVHNIRKFVHGQYRPHIILEINLLCTYN